MKKKIFFGGIVIAIFCFSMLLFSPIASVSSSSSNGSLNRTINHNSDSNSIANSVSTTIQNSVSDPQSAATSGSSNPTGDEWTMFGCSLNHTGVTETTPIGGNKPIWNFNTSIFTSISISNGYAYFGSNNHKVFCLNATTGTENWNYTIISSVADSTPAVANGCVYFGDTNDKIYCLNGTTGNKIWSNQTNGWIQSSPAVANGMVYVGSEDNNIYCFNASNGNKIWNYTTGGEIESSPAVVNGYVFFGSDDNSTYCLNAATGSLIWNYMTSGKVQSSPSVAYGNVFFASCDGYCYCLNAFSGNLMWKYLINDNNPSLAYNSFITPSIYNGLVFISGSNPYCLNASNGALIWMSPIQNTFGSIAISNGMLYLQASHLYCLNISNGNIIWSYWGVSNHYPNGPAIANGRVYINFGEMQAECLPMLFSPTSSPDFQLNPGIDKITLNWQTPAQTGGSPITNYTIYRGISPGNEKLLVTMGNMNNYIDDGLQNGTTYYYNISAGNIFGEGPISTEISAATFTTPSAPLRFDAISDSAGNSNGLYWKVPESNGGSPITNYTIYRGTTSGNETFLITIGNVTNYFDTSVLNNTKYYYEVSAVNSFGTGPKSAECNVTYITHEESQNNSTNSKNLTPSINGMNIGEILLMSAISVISVVLISKKQFLLKNH